MKKEKKLEFFRDSTTNAKVFRPCFVADSLVECTGTPFFKIFKGFSKNNIEEAQRRHNLRTWLLS